MNTLGLFHLANVRAAIFMTCRAVGGAVADSVALLVVFAIAVHGCAVLALANVPFWQALTLHVSLHPEVGEEHKEEGSVHPDKVDDCGELVVTMVHEVILGCVKRHEHKLDLLEENRIKNVSRTLSAGLVTKHVEKDAYQLDGGHVFFPPQKLLEAWPSCRKAIVEVHDDMDSRVHHGMERAHSTCDKQEKHSQSKSKVKGEITCSKKKKKIIKVSVRLKLLIIFFYTELQLDKKKVSSTGIHDTDSTCHRVQTDSAIFVTCYCLALSTHQERKKLPTTRSRA